jgi:hypothetical protein
MATVFDFFRVRLLVRERAEISEAFKIELQIHLLGFHCYHSENVADRESDKHPLLGVREQLLHISSLLKELSALLLSFTREGLSPILSDLRLASGEE